MTTVWRWANPFYLSWLILVPLFYILAQFWGRQKLKKLKAAFGQQVLPFLTSGPASLSGQVLRFSRCVRQLLRQSPLC